MSTATLPKQDRLVLEGVSWRTYESLLEDYADRPGHRFTYDRGTLEIMSPSIPHENWTDLIDQMIKIWAETHDVEFVALRTATWRRRDLDRSAEADACYYIRNVSMAIGRERIDLTVDPPPDLMVEVEWSTDALDKLSIYDAFGVSEVWRYDGERLRVQVRKPKGGYEEATDSPNLPGFPIADVRAWIERAQGVGLTPWMRAFRAFASETV